MSYIQEYIDKNMMTDFETQNYKFWENKLSSLRRPDWEKFLVSKGFIVVDYIRMLREPKYFEVIWKVSSRRKKICLYSDYDLSYKFSFVILYVDQIPKTENFENFYKNFFEKKFQEQIFFCGKCSQPEINFLCTECGEFSCLDCLHSQMKFYYWKRYDYCWYDCIRCGKSHILYKLPAHSTFL